MLNRSANLGTRERLPRRLYKPLSASDIAVLSSSQNGISLVSSRQQLLSGYLNSSGHFYKHLDLVDRDRDISSCLKNPHKGLLTFDASSYTVLTANTAVLEMIGLPQHHVIGASVKELLVLDTHQEWQALTEHLVDKHGRPVSVTGHVVELVSSRSETVASLWLKDMGSVDMRRIFLAILEPVDRMVAHVDFNATGDILDCDNTFSCLFGYDDTEEVLGKSIHALIPKIELPVQPQDPARAHQKLVGKTLGQTSFPLVLKVSMAEGGPGCIWDSPVVYRALLWVFSCLSSLIAVCPDGTIHSCNSLFVQLLTGYTDVDLAGQPVTLILPDFESIPECLDSSRYTTCLRPPCAPERSSSPSDCGPIFSTPTQDDPSWSQCRGCNAENEASNGSMRSTHPTPIILQTSPLGSPSQRCSSPMSNTTINSNRSLTHFMLHDPTCVGVTLGDPQLEEANRQLNRTFTEDFTAHIRHKHGSVLPVTVHLQRLPLATGSDWLWCLWIRKDNSMEITRRGSCGHSLSISSSFRELSESRLKEVEFGSEFLARYCLVKQIGEGGYSTVHLAARQTDRVQVVVKCIAREKIHDDMWMVEDNAAIPPSPVLMEIHLLRSLSHHNITRIIDVMEDPAWVYLVMERLGNCMDLFEFIDLCQTSDEDVFRFIFRQVAEAVNYLHHQGVIHRDIKDENVIVNDTLTVQLIDFGSACFLVEDRPLSTFCGTLEYCCPEVLLGKSYSGPEVDIWSLGIMLYTLIYGGNPFRTAEEIIKANLCLDGSVSADLRDLVSRMLQLDPSHRATSTEVLQHTWVSKSVDPTALIQLPFLQGVFKPSFRTSPLLPESDCCLSDSQSEK